MSHRFRIFDIGVDGTHHDTGKIVKCRIAPVIDGCLIRNFGTLNQDFFMLYGFEKHIAMYVFALSGDVDEDFTIYYGNLATWYLKRGT
jgi:hypothetical protein